MSNLDLKNLLIEEAKQQFLELENLVREKCSCSDAGKFTPVYPDQHTANCRYRRFIEENKIPIP